MFDYLSKYGKLADADKDYTFLGRDWDGVLALARIDLGLPYRDETVALLESIATQKRMTGTEPADGLERIKALRDGEPYEYLLSRIFPKVRASKVVMYYDRVFHPLILKTECPTQQLDILYTDSSYFGPEEPLPIPQPQKPFYMDIRTNMLYDVVAIPNIGVDFYLGKNYTIGANWMYGWWKDDHRHRYWRIYGGDINARYFFGSKAAEKPLTGHHIGIYAGALTFDFEWGGKGYMGGRHHGTLWDRCMIYGGVEYGYSLPVSRHLNIDFTLGIGYMGGLIEKYTPISGYYYWESTDRLRWFGPTKAEISLVWLLGRGNVNPQKGGGR